MGVRMVVVGADATGMAAASQARRLRDAGELEIVVFEKGRHSSYSACGIPYWVAGDVADADDLIARSVAEHRARDIDLRMRTEVIEIDPVGRRVLSRDLDTGAQGWTGYDKLVLATGATPIRPPLPGIDAEGVYGVQTLDDGQALIDGLESADGRAAVVVGAGYIGVEMAEALVRRGFEVTMVTRGAQPMSTLDPDMGARVREAMEGMGIRVVCDAEVTGIPTSQDGKARAVATADTEFPADVVVLGIGVEPATELARRAGLPLGESGGLLTDLAQRVRGYDDIWAGGDCVEVLDLVSGTMRHIPLGTHANKHGQVIGSGVGGGYATFPGVVGTAMSKVCDLEVARTGLGEDDARREGLQFHAVTIESTGRAGYFPGAKPMTVKMLAERRTGRLLGVQIVGYTGAAKRIDIAAVALTARMTVEQVTALDLGYAPPFSPVWDPVLVAARAAVRAVAKGG
ncbi:FAD-dependent oxidoreductase [Nocardia alba]|uniref:NADPH-dependent 2,4-dienoyl-CoA reductase/sulfur reductase-like enzyme n=1 Tax=Nocardia alba TaxID=225051 RepID=A0A4R1FS63_9NOCA|nr:FAD-dependent oxidoreductase [Nocardia alba]TCJ97090.1 NADPH-dependent 2,4-dienoyl-CoA reductase/sulfur reductase-like enzyme [Nocardia alba]